MLFWTIGPTLCFKESPSQREAFFIFKNIQILLSSKFIRFVIHCAAWTLKGFLNSELDMGSMCKIWKKMAKLDYKNYLLFLSELRTGNLRLITFSSLRVTIATGCVPSFGMSKRTYWVSLLEDIFDKMNAFCSSNRRKIWQLI